MPNRAICTPSDPVYGLFGLDMALYFASHGAGRLLWPFIANMARLAIAGGGRYIALRLTRNHSDVFIALAAALATFGLVNAAAIASGAWFDKPIQRAAPAVTVRAASGAIVK